MSIRSSKKVSGGTFESSLLGSKVAEEFLFGFLRLQKCVAIDEGEQLALRQPLYFAAHWKQHIRFVFS